MLHGLCACRIVGVSHIMGCILWMCLSNDKISLCFQVSSPDTRGSSSSGTNPQDTTQCLWCWQGWKDAQPEISKLHPTYFYFYSSTVSSISPYILGLFILQIPCINNEGSGLGLSNYLNVPLHFTWSWKTQFMNHCRNIVYRKNTRTWTHTEKMSSIIVRYLQLL